MKGRRRAGPKTTVTETYTMLGGGTFLVGLAARAVNANSLLNATTLIQADHDNAGDVYVGGSAIQPIRLQAGESITIAADAGKIYVRGSVADQRVRWLALT